MLLLGEARLSSPEAKESRLSFASSPASLKAVDFETH
jgi:hypothetical protein